MNARRKSLWKTARQRGSSLITTLLVLVVLSTIVVAFMQSMSIERSVARSHKNKHQVDLAINAGLDAATLAIKSVTANDGFIVTRNGDYTYLGITTNSESGVISYLPGFSATTNVGGLITLSNAAVTSAPSITPAGTYPASQAALRPFNNTNRLVNATLVNVTNNTSAVTARFAYWIEDLSSKVNGSVAGNLNSSGKHSRPTGTNVSEVALFTLFASNAIVDSGDATSAAIVNGRSAFLSPRTYRQVATNVPPEIQDEITFGIPQVSDLDIIPYGFGYTNRGEAKFNLNSYVANQDVDGLAGVISSNLPNFASVRRGALTDDYNKTLAANIIGYADADSTPLTGVNYRGVDSAPYVTIFHDKNTLTSVSGGNGTVEGWIFVQLWNPSNQEINGTFDLVFENQDTLVFGLNTQTFNQAVASGYPLPSRNVTLKPNEVTVLGYGPIIFRFNGGSFGTPVPPFTRNSSPHTNTRFSTRWNGAAVDQSRVGMERLTGTLPVGTSRWTGGLPGLRHNAAANNTASLQNPPSGDPRQTYYLPSMITQQNHDIRTAWWGMAVMRPMPGRFMTDPTRWVDAAPNSSVPYPSIGSSTSLSESATLATIQGYKSQATPPNTNEAPFIFSNSGSFKSATELGNVFDPVLWNYPVPANVAAPTTIPLSATANANAGGGYGGGMSLRIGRAEHQKFDFAGSQATQLLDLFGADPNSTNARMTSQSVRGKVNLNTAGTNALRALIAGIQLERDTSTNAINPPAATPIGQWFADAVIAYRSNRPFLSVREVASLTNSSGPIFGNRTQWSSGQPAATLKDVAVEELFAKVYDLASVKSRVFRIVVLGQAIDSRGKVVGSGTKEFHIVVNPVRNSAGAITNQTTSVFYEVSY